MKCKLLSLGFFLLAVSSSAIAVDGYKGVKFGSSFNDLKAAKLCSWQKFEDGEVKGIESYYCDNFKFSGKKAFVMSFFINGEFERFAITIPTEDLNSIIDSLKKKYGAPVATFTSEDFERMKTHGGALSVKFDKDTVIVNLVRDADTMDDSAYLIFTSPKYEVLYKQLKEKSVESDI